MARTATRCAAAAVLTGTLLAGCSSEKSATRAPLTPLPATVFLSVNDAGVKRGLQLRSGTDGHVVRIMLPAKYDGVSAATTRDGAVIAAAQDGRCHVEIDRIDPVTVARQRLAVRHEPVFSLAVSPDGRRIGYVTTGRCATSSGRGGSGGVSGRLPNVLVVLNLLTGARLSTTVAESGFPLVAVAFSADGRDVATTWRRDGTIRVMPVDHPDVAGARVLRPPKGCGYVDMVWTAAGLDAVVGCNPELLPSPGRLVRLSPLGERLESWPLPRCIDGVGLASDSARRRVFMEYDVGYGVGGECGRVPVQYIVDVARHLKPIVRTSGYQPTYSLTG